MSENAKILVIDDDYAVRTMICESLQDCGYQVVCAADGEEGLHFLSTQEIPDVVITDIIMPKREGLETIMEIKKRFPSIKLIAISGGGRTRAADFLSLATKLGSNAVLPKPINMDELERTIKVLVS